MYLCWMDIDHTTSRHTSDLLEYQESNVEKEAREQNMRGFIVAFETETQQVFEQAWLSEVKEAEREYRILDVLFEVD